MSENILNENEYTPTISIIIPVYKTEKYLRTCLESIKAQTFTNWECILVDDGSPDNSGAICDEYANCDNRFVVIHQSNKGASIARNAGLMKARGDWIGFVDSDDWIEPECYEVALKSAKENDADLIQWGVCMQLGNEIVEKSIQESKIISISDAVDYWSPSMCTKLIARGIIEKNAILFPENIKLSEDRLFAFKCYIYSKKTVSINFHFYHYMMRANSASHNMTYEMLADEAIVLKEMELLAEKNKKTKDLEHYIYVQKRDWKFHSLLGISKPNFRDTLAEFSEIDKKILSEQTKFSILYFFVYHHFSLTAKFIIFVWKTASWKKIKGK